MDSKKLIDLLNRNLKYTIGEHFFLNKDKYNVNRFVINGTSTALNLYPNDSKLINVLKWLEEQYWLFLEINFFPEETVIKGQKILQYKINISLSVFQGDESDVEKCQLFRAEWDDFNNPEEKHAQPHWHITSGQAIEKTFESYADDLEQQSFTQLLRKENQKIIDIEKIHFAMSAEWQNKGTDVHRMENEQQVLYWLQGMLNYLKKELEG